MTKFAVAIPTFRRPEGLARLLEALGRIRTNEDVVVIVGENDACHQQGLSYCKQLQQKSYRWPLLTLLVTERGISNVRNALVEKALTYEKIQFIAMIDDDEWPEPDWLEHLVAVQKKTGADIVGGPILPEYEISPPTWISASGAFSRQRRSTGPIRLVDRTGNVLFSISCFTARSQPRFDPDFGLSGGEDKDLFVRLQRLTATFAWADEAIVHEFVPASRMTVKWILVRAYRIGNSDMRTTLRTRGSQIPIELAKIAAALLLCPLACCLLVWSPGWRVRMLRKLCRAAGKISALFGRHFEEYRVIHGK